MSTYNETVIVTGSSSGIGLHIARRFLQRGANVVLNGRNPDKLKHAAAQLGTADRLGVIAGDISTKSVGERLVAVAVERFGRVDVLVNNAGTFAPKPFLDVTEQELHDYVDGNLKGTYLTSQAVARQMKTQQSGSIINIGTVLIDHAIGGFPASAPLASKGGVHALTTSLSAELAADGIRVNAVAPGVIRTPLHGGSDVDSFGGIALLNRVGEVDEIADGVIYLADASFVTGHILRIDGGFVTGRAA